MRELVERLLEVEDDLVVTVVTPLDRRRPGNEADRIRLRNLVSDAKDAVKECDDAHQARAVVEGLERAASQLDLSSGADGAVVVASPTMAEAHLLHFPVRELVEVGTTPATRLLLQGLRRSPSYRVLVVSERSARLYEAVRDDLAEVRGHGFPMETEIVPRDRRAVAGRFALEPSGDAKGPQERTFFREVDEALAEVERTSKRPLVLAGVRTSTALFEEVSRNRRKVLGRLDGSHEHTSEHDLGVEAWGIVRQHLKDRRREVVGELGETLHAGKAVTGLDEVWMYARQGRGRLLVVEEDYRGTPSREEDGRLVAATPSDTEVMDDPVDELIEHVVRAGGSVEFVGTGDLDAYANVGLLLR